MVFVCVSIRSQIKLIKPWYARTVLDGKLTLSDVFVAFANGDFDEGDPIDDPYQTTQVKVNIGEHKDKLLISVNPGESLVDMTCLGQFIEFVISEPEPAAGASETVNPFMLMMAAQCQSRSLPPPFPAVNKNAKIQLKNDILKWCESNELGWVADALDQGKHFVSTLADVMWELDGHRQKLSDRGCHVPAMFDQFVDYNKPENTKHRKRLHGNLCRVVVYAV